MGMLHAFAHVHKESKMYNYDLRISKATISLCPLLHTKQETRWWHLGNHRYSFTINYTDNSQAAWEVDLEGHCQ